jgi:class 3 adenylate cyclase/YHS domain-containing protein
MSDVARGGVGEERNVERTFAFVDLAGFTALTEAHGDAAALAIIRAFRDRTLGVLGPGDELVKTIGDGFMLAFGAPDAALRALCALLDAAQGSDDDVLLLPRIGAHHGAALAVHGDYFGAAVNLAARVANEARGGELLVTGDVALAARDAGLIVTHVGAVELRNIDHPVDIYAVRAAEANASVTIDPVCRMRVPATGPSAITLEWSGHVVHFCGFDCVARFARQPEAYPYGT